MAETWTERWACRVSCLEKAIAGRVKRGPRAFIVLIVREVVRRKCLMVMVDVGVVGTMLLFACLMLEGKP